MSRVAGRVTPSAVRSQKIPQLQNGDHLSRDEFERRFDATPGLKKAELIEGTVYVGATVPFYEHAAPHFCLVTLLGVYAAGTPGIAGGDSTSVRLDLNNMPQPDAIQMIETLHGGQAKVDADGYVAGAPELVAEIAASTASYDLHEKLHLYRRHGVREYIVWRTLNSELDYFVLRQGDYQRLAPSPDGLLHSEVFPGFWLKPGALISGDLAKAIQSVQRGKASPEHETFVAALRQRAAASMPANP